jgi:hypothetical protein
MLLLLDLVLKGAIIIEVPPPTPPSGGGGARDRKRPHIQQTDIRKNNNEIILETIKIWMVCH